jgi:hypothetical protein
MPESQSFFDVEIAAAHLRSRQQHQYLYILAANRADTKAAPAGADASVPRHFLRAGDVADVAVSLLAAAAHTRLSTAVAAEAATLHGVKGDVVGIGSMGAGILLSASPVRRPSSISMLV